MHKTNQKTNLFLTLLCKAAKGVVACFVALFLMGLLDNVSKKQKLNSKENLLNAGSALTPSIDEKIKKWR